MFLLIILIRCRSVAGRHSTSAACHLTKAKDMPHRKTRQRPTAQPVPTKDKNHKYRATRDGGKHTPLQIFLQNVTRHGLPPAEQSLPLGKKSRQKRTPGKKCQHRGTAAGPRGKNFMEQENGRGSPDDAAGKAQAGGKRAAWLFEITGEAAGGAGYRKSEENAHERCGQDLPPEEVFARRQQ
ncbi:MAG: hypothetical protein OEV91_07045, partial [Desulfobulbaceae bacterium]|nr:hypothetical protein [Desulfobulbaceae bacterium]